MTDEEKARGIAEMCGRPTYYGYHKIRDYSKEDCFHSAMEMAKWKDEQFKEEKKRWIEKCVERLEPIFKDLAGYNCGGDLTNDFKQSMMED